MIAHRPLQAGGQALYLAEQLIEGGVSPLGGRCQRGIEAVDIGLVMAAVVDLHGEGIQMGFECIVAIRQGGQDVIHKDSLRWMGVQ